jgi:hypothetical protein
MEKFLFLFRGSDAGTSQQSPEEKQSHMQKWGIWIGRLAERGIFLAGDPISKEGKMVNGGNKSVSDGPYKANGESVGGYFIINARSIDEAVEISKDSPIFEFGGSVEVRQVVKSSV